MSSGPARGATRPAAQVRANTIADVALRAGVSTATVSRILSGATRGRPQTRARVVAAARELDYRPSGIARSLKLQRTRTLGLIITDIQNPFYPELVRAVEDAARERGYALLLGNGAEDPEREAAYLELLAGRRVDGIIIAASSLTERHGRWLERAPLPIVLANCAMGSDGPPAILSDNLAGGRMAATYLCGLGHRYLGHITATPPNPAADERLAGFREGAAAAGLEPLAIALAVGDGHVAGGEAALRRLLETAPMTTAVFCFNDLTAVGALRALRSTGRTAPDDVSLVGFDDVDLARYLDPPLTTIAQGIGTMGRWAVDRLVRRIQAAEAAAERDATAEVVHLPVELRVRGSAGPPP